MNLLTVEKDTDKLMEFWQAEQNSPRWFRDSLSTEKYDDETFLEWCQHQWRIYTVLGGKGILCAEQIMPKAIQIHFLTLPDADTSHIVQEFTDIRDHAFADGISRAFGWVVKHNRPVRKLYEATGFSFYGFIRFEGQTHGKVIEWMCYGISQQEVFILPNFRSVLSLEHRA